MSRHHRPNAQTGNRIEALNGKRCQIFFFCLLSNGLRQRMLGQNLEGKSRL